VAPLVGRVLVAAIFVLSGIAKVADWSGSLSHMTDKHLPVPELLLAAAAAIEIVGGVALLLGLKARWAGLMLALYLVPVTLVFHHFWDLAGPERLMQMVHFMKNLAIMGGLTYVFAYGPGRVSIDRRIGARRARHEEDASRLPDYRAHAHEPV